MIRALFLLSLVALILASIAMALPFWSVRGSIRYGLWSMCIQGLWQGYQVEVCTAAAPQGECQGLFDSSRAFAVVGIVFIALTIVAAFTVIRNRKMKGYRLSLMGWFLCIVAALATLFTTLCWVLWLAFVESACNGQPKIHNYGPPFILQVVASGLMLVTALLACIGAWMVAVSPKALYRAHALSTAAQEQMEPAMADSVVLPPPDEDPFQLTGLNKAPQASSYQMSIANQHASLQMSGDHPQISYHASQFKPQPSMYQPPYVSAHPSGYPVPTGYGRPSQRNSNPEAFRSSSPEPLPLPYNSAYMTASSPMVYAPQEF